MAQRGIYGRVTTVEILQFRWYITPTETAELSRSSPNKRKENIQEQQCGISTQHEAPRRVCGGRMIDSQRFASCLCHDRFRLFSEER